MSTPIAEGLDLLERAAAALAAADPRDLPGGALAETLTRLESVEGRLAAVRSGVVAAIEADGTWAVQGARSLSSWLRDRTGRFSREAARMTREARALRDHLPRTRAALAAGQIGPDHAATIVRHATSSPDCLTMLADPHLGEEFLVRQARSLDAGRLNTLLKNWALRVDPEAADRRWKAESEREEFSLARTTDGYHGSLWLSEANGKLLETALQARAGRRGKDDDRTPAQRRAAALVELAGTLLDSGKLQPGARIRPHLAVTTTWDTLLAATRAQRPRAETPERASTASTASPASTSPAGTSTGGRDPDEGAAPAEPPDALGLLERISTALDYEVLRGMEPAALGDGTPIPFGLFAQLACESQLHRVVFGADAELLDVGREQRLFTAGQTRGIIARDKQCRFPDCNAPPGEGEIHHSLWWYAHDGATKTANGILLCRYHHGFVHKRALIIERYADRWRFVRPDGTTFGTTTIGSSLQPALG